uniref:HAD-IC family P-type ATPase n=1 Tax=Abiotrophia defectiva TaxID=46125 RepID=UPI0026F19C93
MKCLRYNKRIIETVLCLGFILVGLVFLDSQPVWGQASFILAFLIGGYEPALEGWKELVEERHLNVDVLMVLAALGAGIIGYWLEGALLIFIFSLSGTLEELAMKKSQDAITALMALRPDKAWRILSDGQLEEVETGDLMIGDRLRVKKGQAVPIDGKLISDWASLDEAMVTGEPIPADKVAGDLVLGGTLNVGAELDMVVTVAQEDTLFAKIVALVKQAQGQKSRVSSLIENLEDGYVKAVLFLVPTFIVAVHFLLGWSWLDSFYRGMILLTVASPCALV